MTRPDPYPSRVGGGALLLQRQDPVVHGERGRGERGHGQCGELEGPLTPRDLDTFERDGFVSLPDFFSADETRALQGEASRLREELSASDAPEVIVEPGSGEVRSVFAIHRSSALFAALANHPRLLGAVTQVLGSPVYIHQSRINYKPGFRGREFYWHSDFETWHVEDGMPRMRALSISLNLLENNPHNGPLMLIPGSHRQFVSCTGITPERHYEQSLRRQDFGVPEPDILEDLVRRGGIMAPVGAPGSIVLFDCNVMHGSNGNITPWPRSNVFLVYNSVENALEEPFSGQPPRPDHIAAREFAPLSVGSPSGPNSHSKRFPDRFPDHQEL